MRPQAAADLGATSLGGVARGPARVALAVRKAAPGRRLQERGGGPTGSIHWPGDVIGGATGVLFAALWEPVGERTRDPLLKWGDPHVRRDLRDQFLPGPRSGPTAWSASTWVGGLCGWRDGRDLATRHRAPQRGATAPGGWGRRISSEPMVPDLRFLWQPHPQLEERATSMGVVRGAAREGSPLGFPLPIRHVPDGWRGGCERPTRRLPAGTHSRGPRSSRVGDSHSEAVSPHDPLRRGRGDDTLSPPPHHGDGAPPTRGGGLRRGQREGHACWGATTHYLRWPSPGWVEPTDRCNTVDVLPGCQTKTPGECWTKPDPFGVSRVVAKNADPRQSSHPFWWSRKRTAALNVGESVCAALLFRLGGRRGRFQNRPARRLGRNVRRSGRRATRPRWPAVPSGRQRERPRLRRQQGISPPFFGGSPPSAAAA